MMDKTIGFIGCGNMAQAMIGGIITSELTTSDNVIASNNSEGKLKYMKEKYKIKTTTNNSDVAKVSDVLILAVKPVKYAEVIKEIAPFLKNNAIIVSIAAGVSIKTIEHAFERDVKLIRTMPNTPAMVGEAMSALCPNRHVSDDDLATVIKIFKSFGEAEIIDEKLIDAVTAISGSSPAYVYMFIEALADGGVLQGIPRDKAYKFAAQAVLGSAKMVLETGDHPGLLKDKVCSPGGTTIEAVYTLEKNNFRASVISAVEACTNKSKKL